MPAVSPLPRADAFPVSGAGQEPLRNPLRDRLAMDADLLRSYETIARRALVDRSLIDEDAE